MLTCDFESIMQRASEGIDLEQLMGEIDSNLKYSGARMLSEYEAELLDRLDESYDEQIMMQRNLQFAKTNLDKMRKMLEKTDDAIGEYCSEMTGKKIFLARGWQYLTKEAKAIKEALSDKELLEQTGISMQSAVSNAISNGVTSERVEGAAHVEQNEISSKETEHEGESQK